MITVGVDRAALFRCWEEILSSGQLTEGKYVRMLEDAVAERLGRHAVALNSAGTALYAVMRYFPVPGRVIVPNNTFFATGAMVREAGHEVVLADCSRTDFSLSLEAVEAACTGAEFAVVLTHVGGGLAGDYVRIARFCAQRDLVLIEDAAHALGTFEGRLHAGAHGRAAVFSLYPTKAVPAGEGGLLVTADAGLAEFAREFRNYGKRRQDGAIRYGQGFNFRMDEWTAAVAWLQVRRMAEIVERRAAAADRLFRVCPPLVRWVGGANWYKYIAPAGFGATRTAGRVYAAGDQLAAALGLPGVFPACDWAARAHDCLPIGEGLYDGMAPGDIEKFLKGG